MKVKTAELIGPALNWAVAKCEGKNITLMRNDDRSLFPQPVWADGLWQQNYSTSWSQGGPIIEREKICPDFLLNGQWLAVSRITEKQGYGPTPLIAAMRCYVASKLGDTVDIPEELL